MMFYTFIDVRYTNKASGPDGISATMLKSSAQSIYPSLTIFLMFLSIM